MLHSIILMDKRRGQLGYFKGNYDTYMDVKSQLDENQQKQYESEPLSRNEKL